MGGRFHCLPITDLFRIAKEDPVSGRSSLRFLKRGGILDGCQRSARSFLASWFIARRSSLRLEDEVIDHGESEVARSATPRNDSNSIAFDSG